MDADKGFYEILKENNFDVTWDEEDGIHDWYFWDTQIKKALDWLPLEYTNQGMNSGNVTE